MLIDLFLLNNFRCFDCGRLFWGRTKQITQVRCKFSINMVNDAICIDSHVCINMAFGLICYTIRNIFYNSMFSAECFNENVINALFFL